MSNISRRRIESGMSTGKASTSTDEFGDSDIDDDALVKASIHDLDFDHIDNYANPTDDITRKNTAKNTSSKDKLSLKMNMHDQDNIEEPRQLENGNWACNHRCKDKQACKHMCCREGVTKPPKKTTAKRVPSSDTASQAVTKGTADRGKKTQTKLQLSASKRKGSTAIEELDLTRQEKRKKADYAANLPRDYRALHRLHKVVQKKDIPSTISSVAHQKPAYCYGEGGNPLLSFMDVDSGLKRPRSWSSDYGDVQLEDLTDDLHQAERGNKQAAVSKTPDDAYELGDSAAQDRISEVFGDDESLFGEAMVGIADSEELREADHVSDDHMHTLDNSMSDDHEYGMGDEDLAHVNTATPAEKELYPAPLGLPTSSSVHVPSMPPEKGRSLFFDDTSGPGPSAKRIDASSAQKDHSLRELKQAEWGLMLPPKTSRANVFEGQPIENAHKTIAPSTLRDVEPEKASIPEAYKDLEPWIFKEFGDIVELID
jgi:ATP-dependent DNA helicase HFM1/MER3